MAYYDPGKVRSNPASVAPDEAGLASTYAMSGNHLIDAMLPGYEKWGTGGAGTGATISYSFPWSNGRDAVWNTGGTEHTAAQTRGMTAAEQAVVRQILQSYSKYANITFVEVEETATEVGVIRFGFSSARGEAAYGWASYPDSYSSKGGDIWFSTVLNPDGVADNSYLIAHELNHALGLKHYYDGDITISADLKIPFYGGGRIDWAYDPAIRTYVSTYKNAADALSMDIQALQYLYGANMSYNTGDNVYRWTADTGFLETLWDAGGHDVLDFSNFTTDNIINLNGGSFSTIRGTDSPWSQSSYIFNSGTVNNLYILPGAVIEDANGGAGNDTITGNDANNVLRGNGGNDTLYGGAGSDILYGGTGRNTLDGGTGLDFAGYDTARSGFTVAKTATGLTVTAKDGSAIDTTINIERLKFSDGYLAFDTGAGEVAGSAYRLYQAAFDRVPDTEGLGYWIGRMDAGVKLKAVAESFLASPEFVRTYGSEQTVSNAKYIELLYTHTLGRNYDQGGFDYWVSRLDANATNRGDLLAFFSESNENQARVASAVADGIWYV